MRQLLVLAWVDAVNARTHHRHGGQRRVRGGQRPLVCGGINAQRHAGDDAPALLGQVLGKLKCVVTALWGGIARSHHGQAALPVQQWSCTQQVLRTAQGIEHEGWVGRVQQAVRVARITQCDQGMGDIVALMLQPLPGLRQRCGKAFGQCLQPRCLCGTDAVVQFAGRGFKNGWRAAKPGQQTPGRAIANAGRQGQAQPGLQFVVLPCRQGLLCHG